MAKDTGKAALIPALIHLCDREPGKTENAIARV